MSLEEAKNRAKVLAAKRMRNAMSIVRQSRAAREGRLAVSRASQKQSLEAVGTSKPWTPRSTTNRADPYAEVRALVAKYRDGKRLG